MGLAKIGPSGIKSMHELKLKSQIKKQSELAQQFVLQASSLEELNPKSASFTPEISFNPNEPFTIFNSKDHSQAGDSQNGL